MKIVLWIVGGVLTLVLLIFGLQLAASERVEVIELTSRIDDGSTQTTRLWVVDYEGSAFLRGGDDSGWLQRALSSNEVTLTRAGETIAIDPVPRPELAGTINTLMREKYTWGDEVIEVMLGGREDALPVQLIPR